MLNQIRAQTCRGTKRGQLKNSGEHPSTEPVTTPHKRIKKSKTNWCNL